MKCPYCGSDRMYRNELKKYSVNFKCLQCGRKKAYSYSEVTLAQLNESDRERRIILTQEDLDIRLIESIKTNHIEVPDGFVAFPELLALREDGTLMSPEEFCAHHRIDYGMVHKANAVTHSGKPYYNIMFKPNNKNIQVLSESFISDIVSRTCKPVKFKRYIGESNNVTRVVFSDCHIGMEPNSEGRSMYNLRWDKQAQLDTFGFMADCIISNAVQGSLIIDDLGDYLDGMDGRTVRGNHELPQNMTNEEMYDNGVRYKIELVSKLAACGKFSSILVHNICNDNHAGSFGYFVNQHVKAQLETMYPGYVTVKNYKKFINHYIVGDHCFIITHGKDMKSLKFGFKPHLDAKGKEKIINYISTIKEPYKFVEFSKGDSHQALFDYSSSDLFIYMNYPALSPASQWIQDNYQKGRRGFVIQRFRADMMNIDTSPCFLDDSL